MKNQNGFIGIAVLVAIIIVVAVFGAPLFKDYYQKVQKSTSSAFGECYTINAYSTTTVDVGINSASNFKQTTILQALKDLKAQCIQKTLVDGNGKLINFYQWYGCPTGAQISNDKTDAQKENDISRLEETQTVLVIRGGNCGLTPKEMMLLN